jgi:hypothetical protein
MQESPLETRTAFVPGESPMRETGKLARLEIKAELRNLEKLLRGIKRQGN